VHVVQPQHARRQRQLLLLCAGLPRGRGQLVQLRALTLEALALEALALEALPLDALPLDALRLKALRHARRQRVQRQRLRLQRLRPQHRQAVLLRSGGGGGGGRGRRRLLHHKLLVPRGGVPRRVRALLLHPELMLLQQRRRDGRHLQGYGEGSAPRRPHAAPAWAATHFGGGRIRNRSAASSRVDAALHSRRWGSSALALNGAGRQHQGDGCGWPLS